MEVPGTGLAGKHPDGVGQEGVERVPPVPDLRKAFVFHVAVHRLPKGVDAGVRAAGAKRGNVHAGKP